MTFNHQYAIHLWWYMSFAQIYCLSCKLCSDGFLSIYMRIRWFMPSVQRMIVKQVIMIIHIGLYSSNIFVSIIYWAVCYSHNYRTLTYIQISQFAYLSRKVLSNCWYVLIITEQELFLHWVRNDKSSMLSHPLWKVFSLGSIYQAW